MYVCIYKYIHIYVWIIPPIHLHRLRQADRCLGTGLRGAPPGRLGGFLGSRGVWRRQPAGARSLGGCVTWTRRRETGG